MTLKQTKNIKLLEIKTFIVLMSKISPPHLCCKWTSKRIFLGNLVLHLKDLQQIRVGGIRKTCMSALRNTDPYLYLSFCDKYTNHNMEPIYKVGDSGGRRKGEK